MIRAASSSLLLLLALTACREPDAYSYESNTSGEEFESQQGTQGSAGSGSGLLPGETAISDFPEALAPFEYQLDMSYDFIVYDSGVMVQRLEERFWSDGAGNTSLRLLGVAGPDGVSHAPNPLQDLQHIDRQLFLTYHRGIRLINAGLAARNYLPRKVSGNFSVAGVAVDRYRFASVFGIGDLILDIDPSTNVILAWTVKNPEGDPLLRLVTTAIDYQPDFQGVQWASANVDTYAYDGLGAQGHLGFDPLGLKSSGPGFEGTEEKALMTDTIFQGKSNMHLFLLNDGMRTVAIAQEETGMSQVVVGHEVKATTLNRSDAGGVTILEGKVFTKHVFAVGSIPADDLRVLLASLEE